MEITAVPLIGCRATGHWDIDEVPGPMILTYQGEAIVAATLIRTLRDHGWFDQWSVTGPPPTYRTTNIELSELAFAGGDAVGIDVADHPVIASIARGATEALAERIAEVVSESHRIAAALEAAAAEEAGS